MVTNIKHTWSVFLNHNTCWISQDEIQSNKTWIITYNSQNSYFTFTTLSKNNNIIFIPRMS